MIVHLPSVYLETYKNRIEAHLLTGMSVGARVPSAQISTEMELGRGVHSFWQTQPQSVCTVRRGAWAGFQPPLTLPACAVNNHGPYAAVALDRGMIEMTPSLLPALAIPLHSPYFYF